MSNRRILLEKLETLQCHFTWNIAFDCMIDVELFLTYVTHQVKHTIHHNRATYVAMKGFLFYLQKRYAEALRNFQEAETVLWQEHPSNYAREVLTTYGNCAWIYYHLTNYNKVQFYLDQIFGICQSLNSHQPYSVIIPENQAQKGWSLLVGGFHTGEQAAGCFQVALTGDRANHEYRAGLATSLFYAYKHTRTVHYMTQARELLEAVILEQPQHHLLKVYLADLLVNQDDRRALRLLEDVIQNSFSADILRKAANLYASELKWMSRAISILERAISMDPTYHFLHYELGNCYKHQMERAPLSERGALLEAAMASFQRAAEIDSWFVHPRLELAKLYGEKVPAYEEEVYLQLMEELPSVNKACQQAIYLHWGDFLLHKKGQKEKALEIYIEGLKIFPQNLPYTRRYQLKDRLTKLAEMFQAESATEQADTIYAFLQAIAKQEGKDQRDGP